MARTSEKSAALASGRHPSQWLQVSESPVRLRKYRQSGQLRIGTCLMISWTCDPGVWSCWVYLAHLGGQVWGIPSLLLVGQANFVIDIIQYDTFYVIDFKCTAFLPWSGLAIEVLDLDTQQSP